MTLEAAYSTIAAAAIAEVIERGYAIGPIRGCRLYARGFNDTYEFEAGEGRRYMARLCDRRFRGPANIDYEIAFLRHLQSSGLSVGAPVADREGGFWRMLEAPEGPREFALFERLSGRSPLAALHRTGKLDDQTLADVRALGASLGRMHRAGESFDAPLSRYRLDGEHLLERPLAQVLAVVDKTLAAEARDVVGGVRALLADRAGALSVGHCHGDNHAANTLIADGANGGLIAGWFDFDDAGPGFLAYDLATFLWSFLAFTRGREIGEASRPLWPAFIEGYRQARPIPDADFAAIGLLVSVRHINFTGQYASRIPEWGAAIVSPEWIGAQLRLVRKWEGLVTPAVE
jgi:Ser/Thr protein kinase RdoA (MazF antagonist)